MVTWKPIDDTTGAHIYLDEGLRLIGPDMGLARELLSRAWHQAPLLALPKPPLWVLEKDEGLSFAVQLDPKKPWLCWSEQPHDTKPFAALWRSGNHTVPGLYAALPLWQSLTQTIPSLAHYRWIVTRQSLMERVAGPLSFSPPPGVNVQAWPRPAAADLVPLLIECDKELRCFDPFRDYATYAASWLNDHVTWGAFSRGQWLAMASDFGWNAQASRIVSVFTAPEARGHGLAKLCVAGLCRQRFLDGSPMAYLFVEDENAAALSVYESLGFKRTKSYVHVTFAS